MNTATKRSKRAPGKAGSTPGGRDWAAGLHSRWVCVGLVALHLALGITAAARVGLTFDEPAHLSSGYVNLRTGDYRWDPSHPPLAKMWMAIPLLLQNQPLPQITPQRLQRDRFRTEATMWATRDDPEAKKVFWPRVMNLAFSAAAVILTWTVLRRYSPLAALVGTAWLALDPNVLAHAGLVTTDGCVLLLYPLSLLAFWWASRCVNLPRCLLAGLALGALLAGKFSGVLAVPVVLVLALARVIQSRPVHWRLGRHALLRAWDAKAAAMLGLLLLVAVQAWAVIWAAYRFRYAAGPPDTPWIVNRYTGSKLSQDFWDFPPQKLDTVFSLIVAAREFHLLPEAYVNGFFLLKMRAGSRHAFLLGRSLVGGRWYFYPAAFLLKTPLSSLALIVAAIIIGVSRRPSRRRLRRCGAGFGWPAATGVAVYAGTALAGTINIGLRHLLPIYPLTAMLIGVPFARWARRSPGGIGLAALLGAWQLGAALYICPEFLTFFNLVAGGPYNGYVYLVDSNLDWGQDLPKLVEYVRRNPEQCPINLAYFGTARPSAFDELARCCRQCPTPFPDAGLPPAPLAAGTYVISATFLQGIYLPGGEMTDRQRAGYYAWLSAQAARMGGATPPAVWTKLAQLRFRRLVSVLRRPDRRPDARISATLFVYRVTEAENLAARRP